MKIRFDPRTKIICLIMVVLSTLFIRSLEWELIIILFICLFGFLCGKRKVSAIWGAMFLLLYILWRMLYQNPESISNVAVTAWLGLVFKMFPCCVMAGIVTKSTHVNEFLTAMHKIKISKSIVIPIAVLLRYMPTVKEDWRYIKEAMILRGVRLTPISFFKNPVTVVECLYVPLLITASKTADELSIASVTRGIENPGTRTSITDIRFRFYDYMAIGFFTLMTVLTIFISKVGPGI